MSIFGPPNVKKLKARKNVSGLIKALNYKKDHKVREASAMALKNLKAQEAVVPLLRKLQDSQEEPSVRVATVKALGYLRALQALEPMIAILTNKSEPDYLRIETARHIGMLREPPQLMGSTLENTQERKKAVTRVIKILENILQENIDNQQWKNAIEESLRRLRSLEQSLEGTIQGEKERLQRMTMSSKEQGWLTTLRNLPIVKNTHIEYFQKTSDPVELAKSIAGADHTNLDGTFIFVTGSLGMGGEFYEYKCCRIGENEWATYDGKSISSY